MERAGEGVGGGMAGGGGFSPKPPSPVRYPARHRPHPKTPIRHLPNTLPADPNMYAHATPANLAGAGAQVRERIGEVWVVGRVVGRVPELVVAVHGHVFLVEGMR